MSASLPLSSLVTAIASMLVTSLAWWLASLRDKKRRSVESTLARLERQIGELYGPLLGQVERFDAVREIRHRLLEEGKANGKLTMDQRGTVRRFIYRNYHAPIHDRIRQILDEKMYLVKDGKLPDSFRRYLRASVQEMVQFNLWAEKGIATDFVHGLPLPEGFEDEIRSTLKDLLRLQEEIIRGQVSTSPIAEPENL